MTPVPDAFPPILRSTLSPPMRRTACRFALPLLLSALAIGSAVAQSTHAPTVAVVHDGWTLRSADGRVGPIPFAVPEMVHPALQRAGVIADPRGGDGERAAAWVDTTTWVAETTFDAAPGLLGSEAAPALVFESLDTFADVTLNGEAVGTFANAFRAATVPLAGRLRATGNRLTVRFRPTVREAERRMAAAPLRYPEGPRVFARTPQFRFGWDWGPRLVGVGIPRPVRLVDTNALHARDVRADVRRLTDARADLDVRLYVAPRTAGRVQLRVTLDDRTVATRTLDARADTAVALSVRIDRPRRWEPTNSGRGVAPHLYRLGIELRSDRETWTHAQPLGLRAVALDTAGGAIAFVVNGQPVYAKGANVIPVEVFYPASRDRYRQVLTAAVDAGMNLVRVWGGGHYEDDAFYEIADSLGLMVWQDVAYASAFYPHGPEEVADVTTEVEENVRRLRAHPSLVVWCGGNEVREGWHNWGWQRALGLSPADSATMWDRYAAFVEDTLARVVARDGGGVPYWPNSPSHGWGRAVAYERGDVHYWGVWWGRAPFETYRDRVGRFHSEYGMQAYPAWATVRAFADTLAEANPTFRRHQKHPTGFETLRHYAIQTFARGDSAWVDSLRTHDLRAYAFLTQAMQAEGIGLALEAHRVNAPRTMGSLVWQLNDVWPVVSWSMVDVDGRPKPLWYRARGLNGPVSAGWRPDGGAHPVVTADTLDEDGRAVAFSVTLDVFDLTTGETTRAIDAARLPLVPPRTDGLIALPALDLSTPVPDGAPICYVGRLQISDAQGRPVADLRLLREGAWRLPAYDPGVSVAVEGRDLVLSAARPAFGVWLETTGGEAFADNYLDIWPGTPRRIALPSGVDPSDVRVRSLHDLHPSRRGAARR